jgi:sugar lactone lactonase YvrE
MRDLRLAPGILAAVAIAASAIGLPGEALGQVAPAALHSRAAAASLLAGNDGGAGSADGTQAAARLNRPSGIAVDASGNAYVADAGNNSIRKIDPSGVVTTLAGAPGLPGSANGLGAAARLSEPTGVAVDSAGFVYVADSGNNAIRKISPAGLALTLAGAPEEPGRADGQGAAARFWGPSGVAVDRSGTVYVTDTNNNLVRIVSQDGVVSTLAGTGEAGSADGPGKAASFFHPSGIAIDDSGIAYVADSGNNAIRAISPSGAVTTIAGPGRRRAAGGGRKYARASFSDPNGLAVDPSGNIYVADAGNGVIRKLAPSGTATILAGRLGQAGSADGKGAAATFFSPFGVALDQAGNAYVADGGNHTIRKIGRLGETTTLAGAAEASGSANGAGSAARFLGPAGVALDAEGNAYVADAGNHLIRKISPGGEASTLAGSEGESGSADGQGANARFSSPDGVAVDSLGNVYVADADNNAIRKIAPSGATTTIAGRAGMSEHVDGKGQEALFSHPTGLAVDAKGNIYVADSGNNAIRKIAPDGVVSTLAGGGLGRAEGAGSSASFSSPSGVAVDSLGNVYVADAGNNAIRKVTPAGIVSTLAGRAGEPGDADGPAGSVARFNGPVGIAFDGQGSLYVADANNNSIRKLTLDGEVVTVAGPGLGLAKQGEAASDLALPISFPLGIGVGPREICYTSSNAILCHPQN